ncbi:MAG: hypothetical protein SOW20_03275 [Berryella intestinalis]|uniref:hypothetical protein n=1 Tax=Berryella intestinalis TaxID=1531429 RepID=UPI002A57E08C|nr:hypothetical protein [Berryella intestinalis]MDD7369532.1 hypothetical protein [Berryella intestinalis]MDY3129033.1 hypothetical protein [Berryella intestinalis]
MTPEPPFATGCERWLEESCGTCSMYRDYPHEVRTLAHDGLCLLAGEVMQCERAARACEMWEPAI